MPANKNNHPGERLIQGFEIYHILKGAMTSQH